MDTMVAFIIFFTFLIFSIYNEISILNPLFLGLICFSWLSLRKGYSVHNVLQMMLKGSKKSFIVIQIFILIGAITAVWRACGTISCIVYYGIVFMSAKYFLLSAFLICCIVSFLLGTSFGTVGTIGVVLMILAKSGNVDINMAAGAIIAGAYLGDRCSPMSSSAHLVATLTHTNLYININNMMKSSVVPFFLSIIGYIYLSLLHPLTYSDSQIGTEILNAFDINLMVLFPAVIILLLAFLKVNVKLSMFLSILSGIFIGMWFQHIPFLQMLTHISIGYSMERGSSFADIIQGGGLFSMLNVSLIVLISSAYSGIFEGTGLLSEVEDLFERLSQKMNVYSSTMLSSIVTASFSCNQTLATILTHQFAYKAYVNRRLSNYRLALDMENTVIVLSALIPWNIAGAVPAATLSANAGFTWYAFYLFLVPLTNLFIQKFSIATNNVTNDKR